MTKSCLKHYLSLAAIALVVLVFWIGFIGYAISATVWTADTSKYYKYDSTPNNLTDSTFKYIKTTEFESVNSTWIKLDGVYIRYTTVNGGVKYAQEVVIEQPTPPACDAFKCVDSYGITYDLTKNTVLKCPMVQIKNGVASEYDGAQAGVDACR